MKMSDPKLKDATAAELTAMGRDLQHEMLTCACSGPAASWKNRPACAISRKDIARVETRISQLRKKAT